MINKEKNVNLHFNKKIKKWKTDYTQNLIRQKAQF